MHWNKYFMGIAEKVALKSKDPSTKVGCIIVTSTNEPVSFGYNGMVKDCYEEFMTWERPDKYKTVIHAEMNAILFAKRDLSDCKLYCTHHPCVECLKHILQAKIRDIYFSDTSIYERFSDCDKRAITRLINATEAKLVQIN